MDAEELRTLQAPLKARYKDDPQAAMATLNSQGTLGLENITCHVQTKTTSIEAGLHPATGGDGSFACSAEMLLEALVSCAGVTLSAVATALDISIQGGSITAEGDLDFRGTLGVSRDALVGFHDIRLRFDLETDASAVQLQKLIQLTERYCVVYQTLKKPPHLATSLKTP